MANSMQGVYSPLPQNLSDSDSEKEITMEPVCGGNNSIKNSSFDRKSYRNNGHLNFHNMTEDVLKIKRINPKMTTLRKVIFVLSILICILPIILFLYVLPCSDSDTCPIKISNWEFQQEHIELKGKVNIVHGLFKNNLNLAVLYEGCKTEQNTNNGAISLLGSTGAVAWDFHQEPDPITMDCDVIDVNGNGLNDCLVLDDKGLKAIETISGTVIWHVHSHESKMAISELSKPVRLTDLNNDDVTEFITVYQGKSFLIVCGKTGQALRNIKVNCNNITSLQYLGRKEAIAYTCWNETIVKFYEIAIQNFKEKFGNDNFNLKPIKVYGKDKEQIFTSGNRKLVVNTNGECPSCFSTVSLYDDTKKQLKTWNYTNTYIMKPETFAFKTTDSNFKSLQGHVNGFILKLWHWTDKTSIKNIRRHRRSIPTYNETSLVYKITEKVMLITFNNTDIHTINASMFDITQICFKYGDQSECQPNHRNQEESLLVADLDKDDSQELINHYSTFTKKIEDNSWFITSYLKVFRLESELPKLYKQN